MNIQRSKGYTLIELMTVLAITAILIASTVPLGAYWIERANLAESTGELTHSFGKAIATALKNQHALDPADAIAAICISNTNELTILESQATTALNCSTGMGDKLWTADLPKGIDITSNNTAVSCMCFTSNGFLTNSAANCSGCITSNTLNLAIGDRSEKLNVY